NGVAAYSVTSMTLFNADNDTVVTGFDPIPNNATISYAAVGTMNISVRCNTAGTIGSVKFTLDATDNYHTEGAAPYAMQGDNGAGDYTAIAPVLAAGAHTVKCTPYDMAM